MTSDDLVKRITAEVETCDGRPCIRHMRIRAKDILDMLASGMTPVLQVLR